VDQRVAVELNRNKIVGGFSLRVIGCGVVFDAQLLGVGDDWQVAKVFVVIVLERDGFAFYRSNNCLRQG
jgi:hypothetical protein